MPGDGSRRRWGVAVLLVGVVAVLLLAGRQLAAGLPTLVTWIEAHPRWAVLGYVGSYVVATVAWVPGSILTLAAGALFGLVEGTLYTLIGATAGGTLAFLVARHVAREGVRARLGGGARVEAVDEAVAREGWKVVFLIRLSPLLPFNALNYLFGLTRVRLVDYVTASVLGMAPGTFLYVYAGYTAGKVATAATGAEPAGAGRWALLGLGLVATGVATWLVTRTARRALAETDVTGSGEGTG